MVPIAKLLPGGVKVTTCSSFIAVLAFYHALASEPDYLLSIASLSAASMVVYTSLSCALLITSIQGRHERVLTGVKRHAWIHKAGLQLGLTVGQCALWLGYIGVFIADLYAEYSHGSTLICPSARCGNYFFALAFGYIQFFLVFTQLMSFALVVIEIKSSPRRVLSDRSFSQLMERQVDDLVQLREEAKRIRAGRSPSSFRQRSTSLSDSCRGENEMVRFGEHITFTLTPGSPDGAARRRTRTISVESGLGKIRLDEAKLCVRSRPSPPRISTSAMDLPLGDMSMDLDRIRSGFTSSENGRYPSPGSSDGVGNVNVTPKQQGLLQALQFEILDEELESELEHEQGVSNDYINFVPGRRPSLGRTLYPLVTETPPNPGLAYSPTSSVDSPGLGDLSTPKAAQYGRDLRLAPGSREPRSSRKGGSTSPRRNKPMLFDARNFESLNGRTRA